GGDDGDILDPRHLPRRAALRQRRHNSRREGALRGLGRCGAGPYPAAGSARDSPSRRPVALRPAGGRSPRRQLLAIPAPRERGRALAARADRRRCGNPLAIHRTRGPSRCVRRHRRRSRCTGARSRAGGRIVSAERLPLLKAAYVVARRDFVAILFSRAFFFFLLGPLFPIAVFALAGSIGQRVDSATASPQLGVAMQASDVDAILGAQERLRGSLGPAIPEMTVLGRLAEGETYDPNEVLARREGNLAAVLTGTLSSPELTVTEGWAWWSGPVGVLAAEAQDASRAYPTVRT